MYVLDFFYVSLPLLVSQDGPVAAASASPDMLLMLLLLLWLLAAFMERKGTLNRLKWFAVVVVLVLVVLVAVLGIVSSETGEETVCC